MLDEMTGDSPSVQRSPKSETKLCTGCLKLSFFSKAVRKDEAFCYLNDSSMNAIENKIHTWLNRWVICGFGVIVRSFTLQELSTS